MEASIKEGNIKSFIRLLQCASKFGDELNMHANKDVWELAVTNSSKSAFCLFKLQKSFFCRYRSLGETTAERRKGVKCQLYVKSVLAVLGKATSIANVERVDLTIVDPESMLRSKRRNKRDSTDSGSGRNRDEEDYVNELQEEQDKEDIGISAKLVLKLVCKHGVTKKHSLHLATSEFLRAEVDSNTTPSYFTVSARSLRDMLDHFSIATAGSGASGTAYRPENQLGWMFAKSELRVKSWEGGAMNLSTEIKMDTRWFEEYWVEGDRVDLTLPMKEFRAALTLAEQLSVRLNVAFSEPTQPLTLTSDPTEANDQYFEVFCAIATTNCEAFANVKLKPSTTPSDGTRPNGTTTSNTASGSSQQNRNTRTSSETPAKRKRTSLSMSAEGNKRAEFTAFRSMPVDRTVVEEREPLFYSNSQEATGSQNGGARNITDDAGMPLHSASQRMPLTQQEVEAMTGLGDLDDLVDQLDDADDDDAEEEERARKQARTDRAEGMDGMKMDSTIALPDDTGYQGGPAADQTMAFEMDADSNLFEGDTTDQVQSGSQLRTHATSQQARRTRTEDLEEEFGNDDEQFASSQRPEAQRYEQLFAD